MFRVLHFIGNGSVQFLPGKPICGSSFERPFGESTFSKNRSFFIRIRHFLDVWLITTTCYTPAHCGRRGDTIDIVTAFIAGRLQNEINRDPSFVQTPRSSFDTKQMRNTIWSRVQISARYHFSGPASCQQRFSVATQLYSSNSPKFIFYSNSMYSTPKSFQH